MVSAPALAPSIPPELAALARLVHREAAAAARTGHGADAYLLAAEAAEEVEREARAAGHPWIAERWGTCARLWRALAPVFAPAAP